MKAVRYQGLDELRAIAALVVVPGHIEQFKELFGLPFFYWFPIPGKLGVVLFFVLSGFLITTLLLKEKEGSDINLKKFYIRRVLRIWPLYFLVMVTSILVFNRLSVLQVPEISERSISSIDATSIWLIVLVLPHLLVLAAPIPYAAQAWSIGVEEQFYAVQPFLIKYVKNHWVHFVVLFWVVFSKELVDYCFVNIDSAYYQRAKSLLVYFGCIGIGCVAAILYLRKSVVVDGIAHHKITQLSAYLAFWIFLVVIYKTNDERAVDFRFHALIFAILILNVATNKDSLIKLNNKLLAYLGKISYGLYMYHGISIGFAIAFATHFLGASGNVFVFNVFVYLLTIVFVVSISAVSFRYYEGFFLNVKKRYQVWD